jgi:5-hydroxyisourate hydrolase
MTLSTHVLDTADGRPAQGVPVALDAAVDDDRWVRLGSGLTDADGRLGDLLPEGRALEAGVYRLVFDTGAFLAERGLDGFYPEVSVVFQVTDPDDHYHVPLLLAPWGYTTYRGS